MTLPPWAAAAAVVLVYVVFVRRRMGGRGMSTQGVKEKLEAGATVVDVRSPGEFAGGAFPGALNIPLQELPQRLGEIPRHRPVVLYCASGARSAAAAGLLQRSGYADVTNAGGLRDMPR